MTTRLRPIERAYISGVFDGEGCVYFAKRANGRPRISIAQKNPEMLYWIQRRVGGRIDFTDSDHGGCYTLVVGQEREMRAFIDAILPYAITKRKQLRAAKRWFEDATRRRRTSQLK